jgi:hypothetical protein
MAKNKNKPSAEGAEAESIENAETGDAPAAEEAAPDAPSDAPAATPEPALDRPVWRTFALCLRSQVVAFAFGSVRYLGGELEEDQPRVAVLRSCEGWRFFDVHDEKDADALRAAIAREVEALRVEAERFGWKLVRAGDEIRRG